MTRKNHVLNTDRIRLRVWCVLWKWLDTERFHCRIHSILLNIIRINTKYIWYVYVYTVLNRLSKTHFEINFSKRVTSIIVIFSWITSYVSVRLYFKILVFHVFFLVTFYRIGRSNEKKHLKYNRHNSTRNSS